MVYLFSSFLFSLHFFFMLVQTSSERTSFRFCSLKLRSVSIQLTRTARVCRITKAYDMAQPANKRTSLGMDAFWDKPRLNSPLLWEKWKVQYKLTLLAKKIVPSSD